MKVSLIASAVRPVLWDSFLESLKNTEVEYEVIFAGPCTEEQVKGFQDPNFKYIHTKNIKPAQCYEIARREAKGEVLIWTADDAECKGNIIDKAYSYWKSKDDKRLILSLQTREFYLDRNGDGFCDMHCHSFIGGNRNTPLMAPLAMISREFVEEIGGFDRRFLCGQYENLTVCQAYAQGAIVEVFGDRKNYIEIDHIKKSIESKESRNQHEFFSRPFARGYKHDRRILEESVNYIGNEIRIKQFEPYQEEQTIYAKSESFRGEWE